MLQEGGVSQNYRYDAYSKSSGGYANGAAAVCNSYTSAGKGGTLVHKFMCFCVSFALCMFLCSCDPSYDTKPSNYNYTKWTCEKYNTWFVIVDDDLFGEGIVNGDSQYLDFVFYSGNRVEIHSKEIVDSNSALTQDSELWVGKGDFSPDKMVLMGPSINLGLFEGTELPVTFVREDLTKEEAKAYLPEE